MPRMANVVITGASSGIGRELAKIFLSRGDRLLLLSRRGEETRRELGIRATAEAVRIIPCDATDAVAVQAAVNGFVEWSGPFDLAIANAGISVPTPARNFHLEDATKILRTNVEGMLNLFAAVVPSMVARRAGHFAGVASIAGLRGLPTSGAYSASKAAMQSFLEAARVELKSAGVSVSVVNPGFVRTPMTEKNRFRMPFLLEPDEAARRIVAGLDAKKRTIEFPLPVSLVMRLVRLVPDAVYEQMTKPYARRDIDPTKFQR
jgi:short-subunit dehydrogenase